MRFLPHEHADIIAALQRVGIEPATVLFVKRRGRLHIEIPGRTGTFAFFREKTTKLDANGKWQEGVDYYIGQGKKDAMDWIAVLSAFRIWLTS